MASAEEPRCPACGGEMELTVMIPPVGGPYGLEIYTCPRCGRSQDYLVEPSAKAA